MIKIFLSYSKEDKVLAGKIKEGLENIGFECFLAHDDITPSKNWPKKIENELDNTDVFIPILTENFQQSQWANQEVGIAYKLEKIIIPLKKNVDPEGFISDIQALKLSFTIDQNKHPDFLIKLDETTYNIAKIILEDNKDLQVKFKPILIDLFAKSKNSSEGERYARLVVLIDKFYQHEINSIVGTLIENKDIYQSRYISGLFLQLLQEEYSEYIKIEDIEKIIKKISKSKTKRKTHDEHWHEVWDEVKRFIKNFNRYPQKDGQSQDERHLGNWIRDQRRLYRDKLLKEDRKKILKEYGFHCNIEKKSGRKIGSKDKTLRKIDGYYKKKKK